MTQRTPEASQRIAARIAGFTLLLLILSGVLGTFVFHHHISVSGDASATAQNILAHERSFRIGLACQIVMFNCDIILALALYALLQPINEPLALLGSFWRVANAIVLGVGVAATLLALSLLRDTHTFAAFSPVQLQALMALFMRLDGKASSMGLLFFSLGAAVHSYLLLKSGYIPKILSAGYLIVAIQLAICCFAFIIFPKLSDTLGLGFVLPDFIVELSVALWLAFKGAKIPPQPSQLLVS
jgi:hypothetical protein